MGGARDFLDVLRRGLESMKFIQAITGSGAFGAFVHATTYVDTRDEAFGACTGLASVNAFVALLLSTIVYLDISVLDTCDQAHVAEFIGRFSYILLVILSLTVSSL